MIVLGQKKDNYGWLKIIFCFAIPYLIIYILAGFISLLPNKLLNEMVENYTSNKNFIKYKIGSVVFINLVIGIAVTIKNFFNFYFIKSIQKYIIKKLFNYECESITNLILSEILLFLVFSCLYLLFIFFIHYYNNNYLSINDDKNKANNEPINLFGNIFIKTDSIYSLISIKRFGKYILSILTNAKIIFLLFINFCSRIQKLKFKTEYKERIKEEWLLFLNFLSSFLGYTVIYGLIYGIFTCCVNDNQNNENNKNNNKIIEVLILISLIIVFFYVFMVSLIFFSIEDAVDWIIYLSIALTGCVNFILYDFYSCYKAEYISLSGVVSLSQFFFRATEFFLEPFEHNSYYILQIISSLIGLILTIIYLYFFLERNINFCWCI